MKIKVFTTGGSIDKTYSTQTSSFEVGEPQAGSILRQGNLVDEFEVVELLRKDSLEITPEDRRRIVAAVAAAPEHCILVTHGTDTLAETGRALAHVRGKVIVLTGAMQPADFTRTDAFFNLGGAVIALQTLPEGVYLVMNGRVFDPQRAVKDIAHNRFEEAAG
jgi:L-asparaginase